MKEIYKRKVRYNKRLLETSFPKKLADYLGFEVGKDEYIEFCINDRGEVVVRKAEEK